MNLLNTIGVPISTGNGGGLPPGTYWADTLTPPAPLPGMGWNVGPPPAAISGSANISLLTVKAVALVPTNFAINTTYKGTLTDAFFFWNGVAYTSQAVTPILWPIHPGYATELGNAIPTAPPSNKFWAWVATEGDTSGGNLRADNFGVT